VGGKGLKRKGLSENVSHILLRLHILNGNSRWGPPGGPVNDKAVHHVNVLATLHRVGFFSQGDGRLVVHGNGGGHKPELSSWSRVKEPIIGKDFREDLPQPEGGSDGSGQSLVLGLSGRPSNSLLET
jgi:hypothetical protein